jgi:hypothetical protein
MVIRSADKAREVIADALWWLKGFAAAQQDDTADSLANGLAEIRLWIDSLERGSICRLGNETSIVLRFADFERIVDSVKISPASKDDHLAALAVIDSVLAQYRAEEREAREGCIPF